MYDIPVYEIVFQAFAHDRAKANSSAETLGKPAWTRVSLVDIYSSSVAPSCMGTEPARTQGQRPYVNPIHFTETVATALSCLVSVQRPYRDRTETVTETKAKTHAFYRDRRFRV